MFPDKFIGQGLTYDDVLLVPNYSEILPGKYQLLQNSVKTSL